MMMNNLRVLAILGILGAVGFVYGVIFWLGLTLNKNEGYGAINNDFAIGMVLGPLTLFGGEFLQVFAANMARVVAAKRGGFKVYLATAGFIPLVTAPPFQRQRFHLFSPTTFVAGKEAATEAEMKVLNRVAPLVAGVVFLAAACIWLVLNGRREAALFVTISQFFVLMFGVRFWQLYVSDRADGSFRAREKLLKDSPEVLQKYYWQVWFHYETLLQPIPEVRRRLATLNPADGPFSRAGHVALSTHLDILDDRDEEALARLRANHEWLMQSPTEFDVAAMCLPVYAGLEAAIGKNREASDAIYEKVRAQGWVTPGAEALRHVALGELNAARAFADLAIKRSQGSGMPLFTSGEVLMKRYVPSVEAIRADGTNSAGGV